MHACALFSMRQLLGNSEKQAEFQAASQDIMPFMCLGSDNALCNDGPSHVRASKGPSHLGKA